MNAKVWVLFCLKTQTTFQTKHLSDEVRLEASDWSGVHFCQHEEPSLKSLNLNSQVSTWLRWTSTLLGSLIISRQEDTR